MGLIVFMMLFGALEALHCNTEFNHVDSSYEVGNDITCQGITNNFSRLLQDIQVINEISLRMENCSLTNVSSNLFQNVGNLRRLYLQNSTFTYPRSEAIFRRLNKLEELSIVNTKFIVTKYSFQNLTSLRYLSLVNNDLANIDKGSFEDLSDLEELEITHNHLTDLNNIPMCILSNLKTLNLSRNMIEDLDQAFYCEKSPSASFINVNRKDIRISTTFQSVIPTVSSTELYLIDLSYNSIRELHNSFALLKSLRVVKLQGNELEKLDNSHFLYLEYLEDLQLNNNRINSVEDGVFKDKNFLERIDLSNNDMNMFNLKYLKTVKRLHLSGNKLKIDSVMTISDNNSLEELILDNNNINEIPPNAFKNYARLKSLHLNKNKIKLVSYSLNGLFNLKNLYISDNIVDILPKDIFKDLANLTLLDLSQNKLSLIEYNGTFARSKYLEVLNISRNSLTSINYNILKPLRFLRVLDISYNKLHFIDYDAIISNLPSLNVLDIKFNLLSCELLTQIINHLRSKQVTYTVQEELDLDKVNIGGIYCIRETVKNNTIIEPVSGRSVIFDVTLGLIIVLIVVVLSIIIFKVHIYLKRRKYRADEFELIDE